MKKRLRLLTSLTALIVAPLILLGSSQALWALGLGDIKAESALNEPLVAKIELLNVSTLSDRDLIVDIGSREDYRMAGVERDYFHTDLTLEAFVDGQGKPYISVTSSRPVLEPFVNFVVQVRWPQGKLLREYTILLDLPVFTGRTQQQKPEAPKATQPKRTTAASSRPSTAIKKAPQKPERQTSSPGGEYLVRNGDTLWSLAGTIATDTGTTRKQVMMAIRDGNPNAFMNGDPNALKAGVVLRMPDQRQAGQRSASDAAAEFANLQQRSARALEATPVRSSSNNFREQSSGNTASQGRLALSSQSALGAGDSAGSETEASKSLAKALAGENEVLKEELDRVEVERNDLSERVSLLEEQLEVALLAIEDTDMAAVQEGLQEISEQADTEKTAEAIEQVTAADEQPVEPIAQEQPEGQIVAQVEPDQSEQAPQPSIIDTLMGFLPYIGAVIVIVLLVVMFAMKRRKAKEQDDDLFVDELDSDGSDSDDLESDEMDEEPADDVAEAVAPEPEESAGFAADDDDDFEEGLESMDELFADDAEEPEAVDDETAEEQGAEDEGIEESSEIDDVNEEDVEDIDLEGALEDLDEFADLDSFFDSDDIEDFDPDAAEGFEEGSVEEEAESAAVETENEEDEFSETVIASADDLDVGDEELDTSDASEETSGEEESNEMDFESFDLPEEDAGDDESTEDLHDEEHSMDFDEAIELPELDGESEDDPLDTPKEDDANSMEFDLDDFDPIGDADAEDAVEVDTGPAENEMEFDSEDLELPSEVEEGPAEDLHDEEHQMDFDANIELPEAVEEEAAESEDDSENSMAFDVSDLDLPEVEEPEESVDEIEESVDAESEDLSGLDLGDSDDEEDVAELSDDLSDDLEGDMDELLAGLDDEDEEPVQDDGDDFDLSDVDLGTDEDDLSDTEGLDLGDDSDEEPDSSDDELDLGEDLNLDDDLNLDEGLDLDDDLLADFGDDASGDDEEMDTKLELAEAYVEMVDIRGAKELISEILADGNDDQKEAAQKLAERIEGL